MDERPLAIAAAARPHPSELVSGDAWTVQWVPSGCRIALIDGLGHGPEAAAAASAAVDTLERHPELEPADALRACHCALTGTRGAAVTVACIEPAAGTLRYAAVGNVEGLVRRAGKDDRIVAFRGIVGGHHLHVRPFTLELQPPWLLLLHTDGVSGRFGADDVPEIGDGDAQTVADAILRHFGRPYDDATVVVVAPRTAAQPAISG